MRAADGKSKGSARGARHRGGGPDIGRGFAGFNDFLLAPDPAEECAVSRARQGRYSARVAPGCFACTYTFAARSPREMFMQIGCPGEIRARVMARTVDSCSRARGMYRLPGKNLVRWLMLVVKRCCYGTVDRYRGCPFGNDFVGNR